MSSRASVTHWLELLKGGNLSAARPLWERYFPQLVSRARRALRGRHSLGADEEDIALSALESFCRGASEGRIPSLNDRRDLWRLLLTITARKVTHLIRDERREKRGGGRVRVQADLVGLNDGDILARALGAEPTPEFAAQVAEEFSRLLHQLGTDELRSIAISKMEGYTDEEIAARLGKSVRTVARKLTVIRDSGAQGNAIMTEDYSRPEDLEPGQAERLDPLCDHFEAEWLADNSPLLEDYLAKAGESDRPALLRQLLGLEVEYRLRRGDRPTIEEYRRRLPNYASAVDEILAQFGKTPLHSDVESDSHMASTDKRPKVPSAPETLPATIARYQVEEILGKGSFGVVYLAYDDQLDRQVAIKVPQPAHVQEAATYLSEARAAAKLDHPNIVPVYDYGSTADFPCFIVSKYVSGTDLATRLEKCRIPLHEALQIVATVAKALHYAHKEGVVHRDIKPGNILLDQHQNPFVADFGLALREEDSGKGAAVVGTPAYMSPEQARGEGHRVDGRSDIFNLGVVLYELLTGKRPFRGANRDDLLEQIAALEPCPPRQIDDAIPKEIERICLKALSKRATDRYLTANDLADDVEQWLKGNESCESLRRNVVTYMVTVKSSNIPLIQPTCGQPLAKCAMI